MATPVSLALATPEIMAIIATGAAWVEGETLFGRAADGVTVQLGDVRTAKGRRAVASYLASNPTPKDW